MASDHKMNKRGNELFGRVKKLSGWGFDTNGDYTRKVNLQREREGLSMDFEALPTWAEKVNNIIFPMVDEITDAFGVNGIHLGMDELFLIGDKHSPSTFGKDPAKLFAIAINEFQKISGHLLVQTIVLFFHINRGQAFAE